MYDNHGLMRHIRERLDLLSGEKYVALLLATYRNGGNGDCFPNQKRLAFESGMSREHINRMIKQLEVKGVVRVEKGKRRYSRRAVRNYVFLWDD